MQEKIWAILVHLSMNEWTRYYEELPFEEDFWNYVLKQAAETGINTVVLDVGDGIVFDSHPEIAVKNAWSREKLAEEIAKCRAMGLRLIPKLNFSAPHCRWLGRYYRMISSETYYTVCRDLITELYELFEQPEYIHIGMDEEDEKHCRSQELAVYRQGELYWHDLRFLIDCVKATGARPWMWTCPLFEHPEEYARHIAPDEAVLSPWYYNAFRRENWTPVSSRREYVEYYSQNEYAHMNIQFVEQDPFYVRFREVALPLLAKGYRYIPCASVANVCDCNTEEIIRYFKENAPEEQLLGYITAPWRATIAENKQKFDDSFRFLKEARAKLGY